MSSNSPYVFSNLQLPGFRQFLLILLIAFSAIAKGDERMIQSSDPAPTVIELYTSQGCSSCPPAENWINRFTNHPELWSSLIPINFHVDYWDYLGWKDPFALPDFSLRQRSYRRSGLARNVATPGFVVNGEGWNGWFYGRNLTDSGARMQGELSALINGDSVSVQFKNVDSQGESAKAPSLHLARLGFGIQTTVKRGENAGKVLQHDFVVTGYSHHRMNQEEGRWTVHTQLPQARSGNAKREAIVIWVQNNAQPTPIQIAADWL